MKNLKLNWTAKLLQQLFGRVRGMWSQCFLWSSLRAGFALFHLLISFFSCSDLFYRTVEKNPKHVLNIVWISSQKVTKSPQLRTPLLDHYWFLSSDAGAYWEASGWRPEHGAATTPTGAASFHTSGQQEQRLVGSSLEENKVEDPKATTPVSKETWWAKPYIKMVARGETIPQFCRVSKLVGVSFRYFEAQPVLLQNICTIHPCFLLRRLKRWWSNTSDLGREGKATFSISSTCHEFSLPKREHHLPCGEGCRGSPPNCLFLKVLRLRN